MLKIHLLGKHANKTPFFYESYKPLFSKKIAYVDDMQSADILVTGYLKDIFENKEQLINVFKNRKEINFLILSEEPLWDTAPWDKAYKNFFPEQNHVIFFEKIKINIVYLNHSNSDIYKFRKIPYFITTNNDYWLRYVYLFKRNAQYSKNDIKNYLKNASTRYAFIAEKRTERAKYDFLLANGIAGLSVYRTDLAAKFTSDAMIEGFGWHEDNMARQKLPDWHLDKLTSLDKKAFIISALENTHVDTYVSEKIFDAYACVGIPIYYAGSTHSIRKLGINKSFINVFSKNIPEAYSSIVEFKVTNNFLDKYQDAQQNLKKLFSEVGALHEARVDIVNNVLKEINF